MGRHDGQYDFSWEIDALTGPHVGDRSAGMAGRTHLHYPIAIVQGGGEMHDDASITRPEAVDGRRQGARRVDQEEIPGCQVIGEVTKARVGDTRGSGNE